MSADGNSFNGNFTRIPSVQTLVSTSGLSPLTTGAPLVPGFIGQGFGGTPGKATTFTTPAQALATLRGGDLLDAVLRCFGPSDSVHGATSVVAMRVNPATQAAVTLKDGSAGNTITVTSVNYGQEDNNISIKIAAGSTTGQKVTISYTPSSNAPGAVPVTVSQDNIARTAFTMLYTGAGATASVTINETTLTTTTAVGGAENLNISLSQYNTVQSLVSYINSAFGTIYTLVVTTPNPSDPTLNGLDHQTTLSIKTAANITSNVQQIVNYINSGTQTLVTAARATGTTGLIPANGTFFLTGGLELGATHLDGSGTNPNTLDDTHDWQYAVNQMANAAVDIEAVLTGDTVVWGQLATSVGSLSSNGITARRGIVGTALGQSESTIATVISNVQALNSDRIMCVMQGINDVSYSTGLQTSYAGYITAAQVAGIMAGQSIGTAATYKELKGNGLEWIPTSPDIENLLANGIAPIQWVPVRSYARLVRGISTWLQNSNFFRVEFSTGQAVDKTVKDIMLNLEPLIGQPVGPNTVYVAASTVSSVLLAELNAGILAGAAPAAATSTNPAAYSNIQVTGSGDTLAISFQAAFVVPTNFINVTINANTFTGSSSVAVSS